MTEGVRSPSAAREAWAAETGGLLAQGELFSHTFEASGEYVYFCIPHERNQMVGTIAVE